MMVPYPASIPEYDWRRENLSEDPVQMKQLAGNSKGHGQSSEKMSVETLDSCRWRAIIPPFFVSHQAMGERKSVRTGRGRAAVNGYEIRRAIPHVREKAGE
jgi:hypothetical protein